MDGTVPGTSISLTEFKEYSGKLPEFRGKYPNVTDQQLVAGLDALIVEQQETAVRLMRQTEHTHGK